MHARFTTLLAVSAALLLPLAALGQEVGDQVILTSSNPKGVPVHPADGDMSYVRWWNGTEASIEAVGRWFKVVAQDGDTGWVTGRYITVIPPEDDPADSSEQLAYVVGTWNIEHFKKGASRGFPETLSGGRSYPQHERDLGRIAEIIRDHLDAAVLALTEINGNNSGTPRSDEMDDLLEHLGSSWKYWIARDGGSQRVALLYDQNKATRGECHEFTNSSGPRNHLGCQFTFLAPDGTKMNDLVVIGVHLKSGQYRNTLHNAEMKDLSDEFGGVFDGSPFDDDELDVVITGDFNANLYDSKHENFWYDYADAFDVDVLAPNDVSAYSPTRLAKVPLRPNSYIDYVMASRAPGGIGELLVRSTAHVHDELLSAPFEDFRRIASDHLPVTVRIRVTEDDD